MTKMFLLNKIKERNIRMKIIHCADLHLGSRLTALPTGDIRDTRKKEILKSFNNLIDYAREKDIKIIVLAGDVFDSDRPSMKDKQFFYKAIKGNPEIKFLYLRGNHDIEESLEEECENLYLFDDSWKSYQIDGVTFTGIELSPNNKTSLYSSLSLDKNDTNIVIMHGDVNTKGSEFIDIKKLANKNIDYLALGHIHMYQEIKIDSRGEAIYPGCLDGRGFDELGEKGFVVLDINEGKVSHEFIKASSRLIIEKEIDISDATSLYEAKDIVQSEVKSISTSSIVKVVLTGKIDFDTTDIEQDIASLLSDKFFHIRVESELKHLINIKDYENDLSLKGEFVRTVSKNKELTDEEKEEILNIGIKLLNGEDVK